MFFPRRVIHNQQRARQRVILPCPALPCTALHCTALNRTVSVCVRASAFRVVSVIGARRTALGANTHKLRPATVGKLYIERHLGTTRLVFF